MSPLRNARLTRCVARRTVSVGATSLRLVTTGNVTQVIDTRRSRGLHDGAPSVEVVLDVFVRRDGIDLVASPPIDEREDVGVA